MARAPVRSSQTPADLPKEASEVVSLVPTPNPTAVVPEKQRFQGGQRFPTDEATPTPTPTPQSGGGILEDLAKELFFSLDGGGGSVFSDLAAGRFVRRGLANDRFRLFESRSPRAEAAEGSVREQLAATRGDALNTQAPDKLREVPQWLAPSWVLVVS
jgi:hypothetical protein